METVWINGEFKPLSEGHVGLEDRALLFGEGIYEVIAAYQGVPILLEEHLERWERSAAGLRLPLPYTRDQRREVLMELIARSGSDRISLYGQLSRGESRRAHQFPATPKPNEFWFARNLAKYPPELHEKGVKVYTHLDERWARRWIKSTSLLPNCIAKQYATERGGFEAILFNEENIVTEGAVANFWVVKNGVVYTHPANGRILGGCKRAMVLELARAAGIDVREETYSVDFMMQADEAFLTSTTINVLPVVKADDMAIGSGTPGALTRRLMELVDAEISSIIEAASAPAVQSGT
ncbi:D-amino-acid transaminase [bacterium]|nr:D-amino-acid transaminase [bacterium]